MRRFLVLGLFVMLALPAFATATEAPPFVFPGDVPAQVAPAPSIGAKLVELITSPTGLGLIITTLGGIIGAVVGVNEVRRRRIALATYHAFHVVEDLSKETENTVDDKIATGLKSLNDYLVANGWRALKPGEEPLAKLGFQSLNGASKLAEKVAANAIAASVVPVAATASSLEAALEGLQPRPPSP